MFSKRFPWTKKSYSTDPKAIDFHLAEFNGLRREIEMTLEDEQRRERHTVLSMAAVWTWLATTKDLPPGFVWAWLIPFMIAIFGAMRVATIWARFKQFRTYLVPP